MIPSPQNHPWHLPLHSTAGVGGTKFTIANRCSESIWPVVQDKATKQTAEYALLIISSVAFHRPSGWNGRVWAKTGCIFNDSGSASCATGDPKYVTLAEFSLRSGSELSTDLYDVSLVDGFNLPLLIEPSSRGWCASTGCVADLKKSCPREIRTQGGAAFRTPEYCCPDGPGSCGPTNYSRVFKKECPTAYSYVYDDASSLSVELILVA